MLTKKLTYAPNNRYSNTTLEETSTGKLFFVKKTMVDLGELEIVNQCVDTVRQLFYGTLDIKYYESLKDRLENGDTIVKLMDRKYGIDFHLGRVSGDKSGYRYKLQNNELGVIILFGSFRQKLDKPGNHLKIELSPHFIANHTPETIMQFLTGMTYKGRGIAGLFLTEYKCTGVAVHLATDIQGIDIPDNFLEHFTSRNRTIRTFHGATQIDLSEISTSVTSYGNHKGALNYLIGKASALQLCIYDKTHESIISDKTDFHQSECMRQNPNFQPDQKTRRIEVRFHHSIIREIGDQLGMELNTIADIEPILTDLWRYALETNRLDTGHTQAVTYDSLDKETGEIKNITRDKPLIHPLWQVLIQDVEIYVPAKDYQIKRKKKESTESIAKNIDLLVGNLIKIAAHQGYTAKEVFNMIKKLPLYSVLGLHYSQKGKTESGFFEYIEKRMSLHRLIGKAA